MTYKFIKLGYTDLVFSLLSEIISRSVHAGLHVCV